MKREATSFSSPLWNLLKPEKQVNMVLSRAEDVRVKQQQRAVLANQIRVDQTSNRF
jgi:N-acetylmuramoyl-L-alanine amidase